MWTYFFVLHFVAGLWAFSQTRRNERFLEEMDKHAEEVPAEERNTVVAIYMTTAFIVLTMLGYIAAIGIVLEGKEDA